MLKYNIMTIVLSNKQNEYRCMKASSLIVDIILNTNRNTVYLE